MYCTRCGGVNGDGATACSACQNPLDPTAFQGHQAVPEVPNYLVTGILTTLCCCMPAGIVSIVFAVQSNSRLEVGDYLGAQAKARLAYTWAWVAFGLGAAVGLLQVLAEVARS